MILFSLFFVVMIADVSCGSVSPNGVSVENRLENGKNEEVGATPAGHAQTASPSQNQTEAPEQSKVEKISLDITFEDALGNQQKLKTGEIDKTDVGERLYEDIGCFVKYVNKYKIEYDEDAGELEDVIYYMDLNGKHEKKIADL